MVQIQPKTRISTVQHGNRFKGNKEYSEELIKNNIPVIPIEDYKGVNVEINHKCLICNYIYKAKPHNILRHKSKCRFCKKITMHKNFVDKMSIINPDIEILGLYNTTNEKIHVRCRKCGYEWYPYGTSLEKPRQCQNCSKTTILSENEFFRKLKLNAPNIEVLNKYTKSTDYYDCKCLKCGYIWTIKGSSLINGKSGCRECYRKSKTLTNNEFLEMSNSINKNIVALESYVSRNTSIMFLCLKCNKVFVSTPNSILGGSSCNICSESRGERAIANLLDSYGVDYIRNKTYCGLIGVGGKLLSYDFYLPYYNKLIEFQGKQHNEPVKHFGGEEKYIIQKEHDTRKKDYAKQHNIELLEIWYYNLNEIEEILIKELKLESVTTTGVA